MTPGPASTPEARPLPIPGAESGRQALTALRRGGILEALRVVRDRIGPLFRLPLPGFDPIVVSGPEANRFVLATDRERFTWRNETDPVTRLLRHGVLVEDGQSHDDLRRALSPPLHKQAVPAYLPAMAGAVDQVDAGWTSGARIDMLPQMRRITLLILVETLFGVDLGPDLDRLWKPILRLLAYISPGPWVVWPDAPRWGHRRAQREVDAYLFRLIRDRRKDPQGHDLLTHLVRDTPLDDDAIRDQMLTMLIAGHDTTTALLAWALVLLGRHPESMARARGEVDANLAGEVPTSETLRVAGIPRGGGAGDSATVPAHPPGEPAYHGRYAVRGLPAAGRPPSAGLDLPDSSRPTTMARSGSVRSRPLLGWAACHTIRLHPVWRRSKELYWGPLWPGGSQSRPGPTASALAPAVARPVDPPPHGRHARTASGGLDESPIQRPCLR